MTTSGPLRGVDGARYGSIAAAAVLALGLLGSMFADPVLLVGREARPFAAELKWGVVAMVVHVSANYAFGFTEGARAAYFENHITNLFSASCFGLRSPVCRAGNAVSPYNRRVLSRHVRGPGIVPGPEPCGHAAPPPCRMGQTAVRPRCRQGYLEPRPQLLRAQLGNNLFLQGTVYVAAHTIGLQASGLVGATMRSWCCTLSSLLSLVMPIFPTLSHGLPREICTGCTAQLEG